MITIIFAMRADNASVVRNEKFFWLFIVIWMLVPSSLLGYVSSSPSPTLPPPTSWLYICTFRSNFRALSTNFPAKERRTEKEKENKKKIYIIVSWRTHKHTHKLTKYDSMEKRRQRRKRREKEPQQTHKHIQLQTHTHRQSVEKRVFSYLFLEQLLSTP